MRPHKIEFNHYQTWVDLDYIQSIDEVSPRKELNNPERFNVVFYVQFSFRDEKVGYGLEHAYEEDVASIVTEHKRLLHAWMNRDAS